jgi:hypothetical protein
MAESQPLTSRELFADDPTVLTLVNGNKIFSSSKEFMAGDYVRVVDRNHREIGYWDHQEWVDDPILVMGAILRCAAGSA